MPPERGKAVFVGSETVKESPVCRKCNHCNKAIVITFRRRIFAYLQADGLSNPEWLCDECYEQYKSDTIKWSGIVLFICVPLAMLLTVVVGFLIMKYSK